jgi:hypothetical protein
MSSVVISGDTSGSVALTVPSVAGSNTMTLPAATDTIVGRATTDTLTNKTLTSPTITGASISSMASSVITSGTAQASTSGTTIDFTSIPSWAKRVTVMFAGVKISATAELIIQIGNGSFVITGYAALSASVANGKTSSTAGFIVTQGNTSANTNSGAAVITQFSSSQWSYASTLTDLANTSGYIGGGYLSLSGAIDRVRITTSTGTPTFTAGNINILYE